MNNELNNDKEAKYGTEQKGMLDKIPKLLLKTIAILGTLSLIGVAGDILLGAILNNNLLIKLGFDTLKGLFALGVVFTGGVVMIKVADNILWEKQHSDSAEKKEAELESEDIYISQARENALSDMKDRLDYRVKCQNEGLDKSNSQQTEINEFHRELDDDIKNRFMLELGEAALQIGNNNNDQQSMQQ